MDSDIDSKRPVGRPARREIRGDRVAERRYDLGLTQESMIAQVYARLVPPKRGSDAALRRAAHRLESGQAAAEMLSPLAKVLGTTVDFLLGDDSRPPPDRSDEISDQLKEQLEAGNAQTLALVERMRRRDPEDGEAALLRAATAWLTTVLEAGQLTRRHDALDDVMGIMGWSDAQTRAPANNQGLWLLVEESRFGFTSQLLHGLQDLLHELGKSISVWANPVPDAEHSWRSPDASIAFRRDGVWVRVRLVDPAVDRRNLTLSFVRCIPDDQGLRWTEPHRRDEQSIAALPWRHRTAFNVVAGFDDVDEPTPWRRLGLLVERMSPDMPAAVADDTPFEECEPVGIARGVMDEETETRMAEAFEGGWLHDQAVSWTRAQLWPLLSPLLDAWPRGCWKLKAWPCAIAVELDAGFGVASRLGRHARLRDLYLIRLVDVHDDGHQTLLPWRADSVQRSIDWLNRWQMPSLAELSGPWQAFVGPPRPTS